MPKPDPKIDRLQTDLTACIEAMDTYTGRIIRNVNKLSQARQRKKRLERELAKALAGKMKANAAEIAERIEGPRRRKDRPEIRA